MSPWILAFCDPHALFTTLLQGGFCVAAADGVAPPLYRVWDADGAVACVHRPWHTGEWRTLPNTTACECVTSR
jgi:hypothetical protein